MAHNGDLHENDTHDSALQKIRTAGSVTIPPELFEKLYLTPQDVAVKGGWLSKFGNPTPIGLGGFLLSLTPLACDLMDWRGAGPKNGSASIPMYIFFGGMLEIIVAVFELILGNTYIATVFATFGAFWICYGTELQPFYYAYGNYSPNGQDPSTEYLGEIQHPYLEAFGFWLVWMGVLVIVYLVCALRTNLILIMIIFPLPFAFGFLTAYLWYNANGHLLYARVLKHAGGGFVFVTCCFGWYLFTSLLFAALDFPISLPVFDLSTKIKGATARAEAHHQA